MAETVGVEKASGVPVLALCGESMLLEGLEASLRGNEGVKTVLLNTSQRSTVQVLDRLCPDIIVFDLTPIQLTCVLTFLQTHTDSVLIGLDLSRDQALFLSGEWTTLPTVADLMQVIEARIQENSDMRLWRKGAFT